MLLKSVSALTLLWLPEAMEGPTPVSALLHSCTLVMAGLFSFAGLAVVVSAAQFSFVIVISFLACVFGAGEKDLKKLIATSTVSMVTFL